MAEYPVAVYKMQGDRLKEYDIKSGEGWGYYALGEATIKLRVPNNGEEGVVKVAAMQEGTDWVIHENWKMEAALQSESQDITVNVRSLFQKAQMEIGSEPPTILQLPADAVPKSISSTPKVPTVESTAGEANEKNPKKPKVVVGGDAGSSASAGQVAAKLPPK